jgi:hypothetical protein
MKNFAENAIQQDVVMHFTNNYCLTKHNPRCLIMSVPNESEDAWEGQKKVNTGMLAGAADLIVLLPGETIVFAECKTKTGTQSPAQRIFEERAAALGFSYFLFRSREQFYSLLAPYLLKAGLEVKNG